MSLPERSPIAEIVDAINNNQLTADEMERRLIERIDAEYTKGNQADIRLINACEDLLSEMRGECEATFARHKAAYHQCIDDALAEKARAAAPRKRPMRVAAVAAALVCALALGGIASFRWMNGRSTIDQQQYAVQGHEVTLAAIQSCIAGNAGMDRMVTTDWNEVVALLGFEPLLPTEYLTEWTVREYAVLVTRDMVDLSVAYAKHDFSSDNLRYSLTYFSNSENAYLAVEQNEEGYYVSIEDVNVYVTENVDRSIFNWHVGNEVFSISGAITKDEGIALIANLIERK